MAPARPYPSSSLVSYRPCSDAVSDGDDDDDDEDEAEAEKPTTRKETRSDWELLNDNKAIWLRAAADVTEEEYQKFYKAISKVRCSAKA